MAFWKNDDSFAPFNVPQVGPTIPAMPTPDAKDAEIAKLRADLDQARRDRNSAVECAEVLRGYVAEHKAEIAKLGAEVNAWKIRFCAIVGKESPDSAGNAVLTLQSALAAARAALDGYKSPEAAHNLAMRAIEESHRANRAEAALKDCRAALDGERESCDASVRLMAEMSNAPAFKCFRSGVQDDADRIIDSHRARRAAEAKASRGGEGKP